MTEKPKDPEILRNIPIFNSLSGDELTHILQAPENEIEEYGQKEVIIREEEIGDCMYVVLEGAVEVSIRGSGFGGREITIATLRAGDFFGEQSLLPDGTGRRNASISALQASKLFRIDKKYVLLGIEGGLDESEDVTVTAFLPEEKEVLGMLKGMRLFQSITQNELNAYRDWTEIITVGPGEFVLKESQPGEHLYVILDGIVEVFTLDEDGKITILAKLKPGNYFGEQALMPGGTGERNAYVRTDNKTRLIKVAKEYFRLMLKRDGALEQALSKIGLAQREEISKYQE
ncbi:MAG: cyclic nucleotide-binding domain-containing protein [Gammaproteobacteria bacterium]